MQIIKSFPSPRTRSLGRVGLSWLVAAWCLSCSGWAQDALESEVSRRSAAVEEAQELLSKGDQAYQAGRYQEAIVAYLGARDMIPEVPATREMRSAATDRYVQAAVVQAHQLSEAGDIAAAKVLMETVLAQDVAPDSPEALKFLDELNDPIRTNPALTADYSKNVAAVLESLELAIAAVDLGKLDDAALHYQRVLQIDPSNRAARRGLENVAKAKSEYYGASYDATRAEMLSQVDAEWEIQLPSIDEADLSQMQDAKEGVLSPPSVGAKIKRMMIPQVAMDQVTLSEAVDYLRAFSMREDQLGMVSESRGVNFTMNLSSLPPEAQQSILQQTFSLNLTNVPMIHVLDYITQVTRTSYRVDDYAVNIAPLLSSSSEMVVREYRVPPDFLTKLTSGLGPGKESEDDPFGGTKPAGLLVSRMSVQDALIQQGVTFAGGAVANFSPATNTLRVFNTEQNLSIIDQIVETLKQTEPVAVSVQVTIIKTQQENLKELGFDWLITPVNLNGESFMGGGTVGNGGGRTAGDFTPQVPLPVNPGDTVGAGVITNGLRSGDLGVISNTLDSLISNPNRATQNVKVAPGVLSMSGIFSDGQVQTIMRGLDQKKGVDLMSNPSVVTQSGQAAKIVISREFIYPTEYDPPELPGGVATLTGAPPPVTPANPTSFQMRDVGITLDVLPVAAENKHYVDVTLNPSVVDFDGFVNFGSPIQTTTQNLLGQSVPVILTENAILMPVFNTQRTNTQLTIADGATIAYGGLLSESIQEVNDKVPVLGDLPVIGRMFQSTIHKPLSTAIVFLVRVQLMDPTGRPYREISKP